MRGKYAILIDAGFIRSKLGSLKSPLTTQKVVDFTDKIRSRREVSSLSLHRIYYYDAEPFSIKKPKPLTGGTEIDFSQTSLYQANSQLLKELKKKSYFAVRLGELEFRGWLLKQTKLNIDDTKATITEDGLIPDIRQKQVDMKIGLDIASLVLKNHVVALITADSDFIPALKFARREGKQIFLYT